MSVTDARTGHLLVGAAADKRPDLLRSIDEAGLTPLRSESTCCWVTLVGNAGAVREQVPRCLALLDRDEVEVYGHEVAAGRATFVVPDAAGERAARLIYTDAFGAVGRSTRL
jgi:hypothetical protein